MEQVEKKLSRIDAYNKLVDVAILTKTSSKVIAEIMNNELGIECNAGNVQDVLRSSVSASDMHKIRREIEENSSIKRRNANKTTFLKKYISFSGRISRSEYWMLKLLILPMMAILFFIGVAMVLRITGKDAGVLGGIIIFICFVYFNIVADIRRLHDIGKSGWFLLWGLIPLVGIIITVILFCRDSQSVSNQHRDLKVSH